MNFKRKGYPGNKNISSLYPNILNEFPPHKVYWELFAGSGQILKKKKPAALQIAIEINNCEISVINNYPSGTVLICDSVFNWLPDIQELGKDHLFYFDPPYLHSTRQGSKNLYLNELSDNEHMSLIEGLKKMKSNVVVSHYPCELYDQLLNFGWRKKEVNVCYHGKVKTEAIYLNFPVPDQLNETTYTGQNKMHRQRIKRKADSWITRFLQLPDQEKQVILTTLATNGFIYQNKLPVPEKDL